MSVEELINMRKKHVDQHRRHAKKYVEEHLKFVVRTS